jgi:hypothetical protein
VYRPVCASWLRTRPRCPDRQELARDHAPALKWQGSLRCAIHAVQISGGAFVMRARSGSPLVRTTIILSTIASTASTAAATEIERLSCSGLVNSLSRHENWPATIRDLAVEIDFARGAVRGFGVPLKIISSWSDLIVVAGSYREPTGLVRVTGSIERWTRKTQLRATWGDRDGGPLVSLWDLECERAR